MALKPRRPVLQPGSPLARVLLGLWPIFERGTGGGTRDLVYKRNGAVINAGTWASGEFGPYVTFNGSSDYIDVMDSVAGDHPFTGLSDNLSVMVRFRASAVTGTGSAWAANRTLLELRKEVGSGRNVPFNIGIDNSHAYLGVVSNDTNERCPGTATLNTGQWYLLIVTINGDDWKIYLDGVLDASGTFASATGDRSVGSTTSNLQFGVRSTDAGAKNANYFTGDADLFAIWGRTLTDSDIRTLQADPLEMCRAIYPTLPRLFSFPALSSKTVTLVSFDPPDGSTRAETTDEIVGRFAPTDALLNEIDTVTATVNGASATVATDLIAGGEVVATIDELFIHGRSYAVVWTVTTADSQANIFTQNFTVRTTSGRIELVEARVPGLPRTYELTELFARSPIRGIYERAELLVNPRPRGTIERVDLEVVPGLSAGNRTDELCSVIAAVLVEVHDWCPISYDEGPSDRSELPVAMDVKGNNTVEVLPIAMTTRVRETRLTMPLSMDVGDPETSELPVAIDTGPAGTNELPVAMDADGTVLERMEGRANLRNEDTAADEDE